MASVKIIVFFMLDAGVIELKGNFRLKVLKKMCLGVKSVLFGFSVVFSI